MKRKSGAMYRGDILDVTDRPDGSASKSSMGSPFTKVGLRMAPVMVTAEPYPPVAKSTRASSRVMLCKAKAFSFGLTVACMKVNGSQTRKRARVATIGPMVKCTTASSPTTIALAVEHSTTRMGRN